MRKPVELLVRVWSDDRGAVLATEWLLITTVLVLGLVPGLIAIRQGILAEMGDIASATNDLDQSYGFTGQEHGSANDSGNDIRAAADDGKVYDPVADAAARLGTPGIRGAAYERNSRRTTDRGVRPAAADQGDDRGGIQAFTAGSTFLEDRHLSGNTRGSRIRAISAQGAASDAKACD
jgi:hypothetical protein